MSEIEILEKELKRQKTMSKHFSGASYMVHHHDKVIEALQYAINSIKELQAIKDRAGVEEIEKGIKNFCQQDGFYSQLIGAARRYFKARELAQHLSEYITGGKG